METALTIYLAINAASSVITAAKTCKTLYYVGEGACNVVSCAYHYLTSPAVTVDDDDDEEWGVVRWDSG